MKQGICIFAALLSVYCIAANAASDNNSSQPSTGKDTTPALSYQAPYPFTADQLWEKFLKVAGQPERVAGYVTKEQIDAIFGVTMKPNEEFLKQYNQKIYSLSRGIDWYFDMSVGDNRPAHSLFFFTWGDIPGQHAAEFPPPPPAGMCINVYKIRPSLQRLRWALMRELRGGQLPNSDTYRYGRIGVLKIEFHPTDNCLRSIRITASQREAEELPVE